jgi:hypothetical protein
MAQTVFWFGLLRHALSMASGAVGKLKNDLIEAFDQAWTREARPSGHFLARLVSR